MRNGKVLVKIFLLVAVSLSAQQKLTIATMDVDKDYHTDIIEQILIRAYERIGIEVKVVRYPIKRSLLVSNSGEVDGELYRVYGIDEVYTNLIRVPHKIYDMQIVVLARPGFSPVTRWKDFYPGVVGYLSGFLYAQSRLEGQNTVPLANLLQSFSLLRQQKLDYVISTRVTTLINLNLSGGRGIELQQEVLDRVPLYHYLHIDNRDLVPLISKSLREMSESGETDQLIEDFITEFEEHDSGGSEQDDP